MTDFSIALFVVGFAVLSWLLVAMCDRLMGERS
jgi:hypothetical protein